MLARTPPDELRRLARANKLSRKQRRERATIDFETRSAADLKKVGSWMYSRHESTEVMCLAWHLPGMGKRETKLWHPKYPHLGIHDEGDSLEPLFDYIRAGGMVEAHNSFFEMCIWRNVCVPVHGWPEIQDWQWLCTAAKASAHALPRKLSEVCEALGLAERKDDKGESLLRKYSRPAKLTKRQLESGIFSDGELMWNEELQGFLSLWAYCRQDIRAEVGVSYAVPDLSPREEALWRLTTLMNLRGVYIDVPLCRAALAMVSKIKAKLNGELEVITGIEGIRGSQRDQVRAWLVEHEGLELPDTTSATLEWFIDRDDSITDRARRVITILKEVNRTSTNKYAAMLNHVDSDGRARENLVYCGAERTGRFAGKGIQVHNLPKGRFTLPLAKKDRGKAIDFGVDDIMSQDLPWCEAMHGDVMNLIASCLRGAIIAPPGRELVWADYAAIEARCILWEAGATDALKVFDGGGDIYCDMASGIYGRTITKENVQTINAMGATERDFGKVAILGLGYGMGFLKFLITLRTYNIVLTRAEVINMIGEEKLAKYEAIVRKKFYPVRESFEKVRRVEGVRTVLFDEKKYKSAMREATLNRRKLSDEREDADKVMHELALCKYTVDTYRTRYEAVPQMWKDQEAAAIRAVQNPGEQVECGVVTWFVEGRYLKCRLPSGRCLHYCDPEVKLVKTSWGEKKPGLRFWGRNQTGHWVRQGTYGGKLAENITQAIARDIMGYAKLNIHEQMGDVFALLLSVHDEILGESDPGVIDEDEFVDMMGDLPPCYAGCPIGAEVKRSHRYRK